MYTNAGRYVGTSSTATDVLKARCWRPEKKTQCYFVNPYLAEIHEKGIERM